MFTVPLITLAALLFTQKTSCELLAKEQDLVNHGIIKKSHKDAMFSSALLGNQRRPKEKDVVADFVLMRRLDEHQVCRSLPIKISTKFILCKRRYQFLWRRRELTFCSPRFTNSRTSSNHSKKRKWAFLWLRINSKSQNAKYMNVMITPKMKQVLMFN